MRRVLPILLAAALAACGGGDQKPADKSPTVPDSASQAGKPAGGDAGKGTAATTGAGPTASARRFDHPAGIIEMKSLSGPKIEAVLYFEDYGARMSTQTDIVDSMNGKPLTITNVSILSDGVSVLFDPVKKVGRRSTQPEGTVNYFPRFETLSDSARAALKCQTLGKKTIAGKECTGYSIERNGIILKVWTWDGIPLRSESIYAPNQSLLLEATNVKVDVAVPPDKFTIPDDIQITDVPASMP